MAKLDRHVLRLDARAREVEHVEMLRQPDEVAKVGEVSRALAAVEVADRGRAAHRHRGDMPAAERDVALGRAAEDLHRLRRRADRLLDERALEPHHLRLLVHVRAARPKPRPRLVQEHSDPVLLQDRQRGLVDVGDLVRAQELERRERALERAVADRPLLGCDGGHRPAATPSPAALPRRLVRHAATSRNGSPSASTSTSTPRPGPGGGCWAPSARGGSPLP